MKATLPDVTALITQCARASSALERQLAASNAIALLETALRRLDQCSQCGCLLGPREGMAAVDVDSDAKDDDVLCDRCCGPRPSRQAIDWPGDLPW